MASLSVVIPAFNEEGNIGPLVDEIVTAVPPDVLGEIIVVDDCSTDGTVAEVLARGAGNPAVRCIRHHVNAGQSVALYTGVAGARYPVIGTLDGDGQNDPADLVALLAAYECQDVQLVGGVRQKRRASLSKRLASKAANRIRRLILRDDCPDTGCGIKVFDRDLLLRLPEFDGLHRYLPALFAARGANLAYVPVNDRPRRFGTSKYTNWRRALVGIYDLVGVAWIIRRTRPTETAEALASD